MKIMIVVVGIAALLFFGNAISSRMVGNLQNLSYIPGIEEIDYSDSPIYALPYGIGLVLVRLIVYLTQGYYGLSLGLTLDWRPTFLFGGGIPYPRYYETIFGVNEIAPRLYQTRIYEEYGWSDTNNWHTMYLWLANDFGFVGVGLVMFALGYLLVKAMYRTLVLRDMNALCVCYIIIMALFYSSANNQMFGSPKVLFSFLVFSATWLWRNLSGRKYEQETLTHTRIGTLVGGVRDL